MGLLTRVAAAAIVGGAVVYLKGPPLQFSAASGGVEQTALLALAKTNPELLEKQASGALAACLPDAGKAVLKDPELRSALVASLFNIPEAHQDRGNEAGKAQEARLSGLSSSQQRTLTALTSKSSMKCIMNFMTSKLFSGEKT